MENIFLHCLPLLISSTLFFSCSSEVKTPITSTPTPTVPEQTTLTDDALDDQLHEQKSAKEYYLSGCAYNQQTAQLPMV